RDVGSTVGRPYTLLRTSAAGKEKYYLVTRLISYTYMNTSTLHSKLARTLRKSSVAMNMRSLSKVVGGAVASIIVGTLSCSAVTISGEIHFAGAFTPIDSAENPVSLLNATGIKFQNPVAVLISSGDF